MPPLSQGIHSYAWYGWFYPSDRDKTVFLDELPERREQVRYGESESGEEGPVKTVVLISCGKTKKDVMSDAEHMYQGDLFRKSLLYAKSLSPDSVFILSAKYGLLEFSDQIEPYEKSLKYMSLPDRRDWAVGVKNRLDALTSLQEDRFIFLTGQVYGQYLTQYMKRYEFPLMGLQFGRQLAWLKAQLGE